MPRGATQALNHPRKGSAIAVDPIRDRAAIQRIKTTLHARNLRDYCLFTLGINTAFRASELLSLTVGQVAGLAVGDALSVKQPKSGKYRSVTVNRAASEALQSWVAVHPSRDESDAALFVSRQTGKALCVSTVTRMVKRWCAEAGLSGHFGSHTLRKSWGYFQRTTNDAPLPLLMRAFSHTTEAQTLVYLGIQEEEIRDLYLEMEL